MGCKLPARYLLLCSLVLAVWFLWSGSSFLPFVHRNLRSKHDEQDLAMLGIIRNKQDQAVRDEGYNKHAFNLLISNRLGLHRKIPDTRNKL